METYIFMFKSADFEDLMKGKSGVPLTGTRLFHRVASLNCSGHYVRVIDKDTGELIHEFLPRVRPLERSPSPWSQNPEVKP
jgi:hypothetical protein